VLFRERGDDLIGHSPPASFEDRSLVRLVDVHRAAGRRYVTGRVVAGRTGRRRLGGFAAAFVVERREVVVGEVHRVAAVIGPHAGINRRAGGRVSGRLRLFTRTFLVEPRDSALRGIAGVFRDGHGQTEKNCSAEFFIALDISAWEVALDFCGWSRTTNLRSDRSPRSTG
jgi:hypothetical protein